MCTCNRKIIAISRIVESDGEGEIVDLKIEFCNPVLQQHNKTILGKATVFCTQGGD